MRFWKTLPFPLFPISLLPILFRKEFFNFFVVSNESYKELIHIAIVIPWSEYVNDRRREWCNFVAAGTSAVSIP